MLRLILALAIACIGLTEARSELPPSAYKERQDKAPEALVIKVKSVKTSERTESRAKVIEFTVEAEVEKVERSASKLAPGAMIKIVYSRSEHFQPIAGPSEIPALKEGQVCPAYLAGKGDMFSPAAGGYSFETVR
jgi:hypothetical protein